MPMPNLNRYALIMANRATKKASGINPDVLSRFLGYVRNQKIRPESFRTYYPRCKSTTYNNTSAIRPELQSHPKNMSGIPTLFRVGFRTYRADGFRTYRASAEKSQRRFCQTHPPRLPLQHAERLRLDRAGIMGLVNAEADLTVQAGGSITLRIPPPFPALKQHNQDKDRQMNYSRKTCTGTRSRLEQLAWAPGELEAIRRREREDRARERMIGLAIRDIDNAYKRFAARYGWTQGVGA
jgi:hypothetical protein